MQKEKCTIERDNTNNFYCVVVNGCYGFDTCCESKSEAILKAIEKGYDIIQVKNS